MLYTTTPNVPAITYDYENGKKVSTQYKTLNL